MEHYSRGKWHFLSLLLLVLLGGIILNQQALAQSPYTWGNNVSGQLGDGSTTHRNIPKKITAPTGTATIGGGSYFSLAVKTDGTVWAWGYNGYGQLGNGTNSDSSVPAQVSGLSGVVQVVGGAYHSLALKSDGTVWAWGWNYYGQLGEGTNTDRNVPVQVPGLSGVVQVAAGDYHSLALKSDGTVWAWGWNYYGQLGNGSNTDSNLPVQVPGLTEVVQVSAGDYHSLALKLDDNVWAWGWNAYGQLGEGTTNSINYPIRSQVQSVIQIAAGAYHSVALLSNGTVLAWGWNAYGQLGNGTNTDSYYPTQVANITNAVSVAAGGFHTLALSSDSNVWAWGYNGYGQLGNGTNSDSSVPVLAGVQGMTVIAAGRNHTFAVGTSHDTKVTVPSLTIPYGTTVLKATVTLGKTGFPGVGRQAAFYVEGNPTIWGLFSDASGTFTTPPMTFSVGKYALQVKVIGVGTFNPGIGRGTLKVVKSDTTLKADDANMALGETRNLTATLTQNSDGTPVQEGKVTFSLNGTVVGSANTDKNGVATFAYKSDGTLLVGTHKITASFAGDASHNKTTASATLTINKGGTALTQKSVSAKPSTKVNLTATLRSASDGKALSNQSVTFYVGGVLVGTGTTDNKGVAVVSFTTPIYQAPYPLKVTFSGDASYAKCTYSKATLTVK